jgi:hypothetical protein
MNNFRPRDRDLRLMCGVFSEQQNNINATMENLRSQKGGRAKLTTPAILNLEGECVDSSLVPLKPLNRIGNVKKKVLPQDRDRVMEVKHESSPNSSIDQAKDTAQDL